MLSNIHNKINQNQKNLTLLRSFKKFKQCFIAFSRGWRLSNIIWKITDKLGLYIVQNIKEETKNKALICIFYDIWGAHQKH